MTPVREGFFLKPSRFCFLACRQHDYQEDRKQFHATKGLLGPVVIAEIAI